MRVKAAAAHWQSDDRVKSRAALAAYLQSEVGAAHLYQLQGAAELRLRQLKAALGVTKAGADADAFDAELRKAEHDFDGDAARCRVDALKLEGVTKDGVLGRGSPIVSVGGPAGCAVSGN